MQPSDVVENGQLVNQMYHAIKEGELNIKHIPYWVEQVIDSGAWRKRWTGAFVVEHTSFRSFIMTARVEGLGWNSEDDLKQIESLLRYAPDVLTKWRQAITPEHGGDRRSENASIKNNNIILDRPVQGTSLAYTLDRLSRESPDLYAKVVAKELSANAAAIEAGFRKRPSPFEQVVKLIPKLTAAEWAEVKASFK
jgi:hypothetical protein